MRKKTKVIVIIMMILIIIVLLIGTYVIFSTEKYTCIIEEIEDEIVIVRDEKIEVRYSFSIDRVFFKMNLESKDRDTDLKVGDLIYIVIQKPIAEEDLGREVYPLDNVLLIQIVQ